MEESGLRLVQRYSGRSWATEAYLLFCQNNCYLSAESDWLLRAGNQPPRLADIITDGGRIIRGSPILPKEPGLPGVLPRLLRYSRRSSVEGDNLDLQQPC